MNLTELSQFIAARASILPTQFTLAGNPVAPDELGSETGFLPLIIIKINDIHKHLLGTRQSHSHFLDTASEATHILCSRVKMLPEMPESAIKLYANTALLLLAREPLNELNLPFDVNDESTLLKTSDLIAHIKQYPEDIIRMSPLAFPSKNSEGPTI